MDNDKVVLGLFQVLSSTSVHNPFEVIVVLLSLFISLSLMSTSYNSTNNTITNISNVNMLSSVRYELNQLFNFKNDKILESFYDESNLHERQKASYSYFNFMFIMFLRCTAFAFIFIQFKGLKKMHSKLILITTVLFTLTSSILINNALITWYNFGIPKNLLLIIDIIIYTLIVIDLKKCSLILNNALEEPLSIKEAKLSIVKNFAHFASKSSLDTFFFILFVALGNLSDSNEIKNFSLLSCMLLSCNFIVFITIYPALISLILQFKKKPKENTTTNNPNDNKIRQKSTNDSAPKADKNESSNPVLVYVKLVMTLFLVIIHLKSKIFNETLSDSTKPAEKIFQNQTQNFFIFIQLSVLIASILFILKKASKSSTIKSLFTNSNKNFTQLNRQLSTISTQTENSESNTIQLNSNKLLQQNEHLDKELRSECIKKLKDKQIQILDHFQDDEIIELVKSKHIPLYKLEAYFTNPTRGVEIRRKVIGLKVTENSLTKIPFENYNYKKVVGHNCENVIGYIPIPLGIAGPLLIDGKYFHIPMATTEGTLVASTNRGCNALSAYQGVFTKVISDGMTRGPVIRFQSAMKAADAKEWIENKENYLILKNAFDSTSRFAKLQSIKCCIASRYLYIRFSSTTGDAMGMNMLSKASEKALNELHKYFPESELLSLSGNYCTDKKPSAINWIEGRGKSVVCEAIVKSETVKSVLKTSAKALYDLNLTKNLLGSAMAGSIGGFNAHAANIVTAVFIACGQDPAQVVESSTCLTWMECTGENDEDLYISCTMPSLEVGTVGGGTGLDAQSSCLKMLDIYGSNNENPGENACKLARIIAASVLAGELSLMSALASGQLVNSHMKYNRAATAETIKQLSSNIHCFI